MLTLDVVVLAFVVDGVDTVDFSSEVDPLTEVELVDF